MEKSFEERQGEFIKRYKELIDEYKLDFLSKPSYMPIGNGQWQLVVDTQLVDTTEYPVPSPFSSI